MYPIVIIGGILLIASTNILPPLAARKLVHIGVGIVLALVNYPVGIVRGFIEVVAISAIVASILGQFRFGSRFDIGIISYNAFVLGCLWTNTPLRALLCMFIVDPVAAIVGRAIPSPTWCKKKTVSSGSLQYPRSMAHLQHR
ncbi:hypothetical protein BdWA1_002752 [Babesia duncani]|uniref:Uncharacterized protein n=1 Tax=Babesia duncani TaxID=323732 RepID=A0AAD9UNS4_9APIC|nr:hypothetical protein BdWA1_002752 [Babesia duncani]